MSATSDRESEGAPAEPTRPRAAEPDITSTGMLERLMPIRRAEQRVGILEGPFDPGGQPVLESDNRFFQSQIIAIKAKIAREAQEISLPK